MVKSSLRCGGGSGQDVTEAFKQLKKYFTSPLLLTIPKQEEQLYMYLAISKGAVSAALFIKECSVQQPIFYIIKSLIDVEKRYSPTKKVVLALVTEKKKLCQYFEAHTIVVLTNQPSRAILSKSDLLGRITKWAIELSSFDIKYRPRSAAKGLIIVDFLVECYPSESLQGECKEIAKVDPSETKWELYVDGLSNQAGAGAGIILISPEGINLKCSIQLDFPASNNVTEYEALVLGLELAKQLKISCLTMHSDSQLIVGQTTEEYTTKNARMKAYQQLVKGLVNGFKHFELKQIPRKMNEREDQLACMVSAAQENLRIIEIEYLYFPSIGAVKSDVMQIDGQGEGLDSPLRE